MNEAPGVVVGFAGARVARVDGGDTVDVEVVAIGAGGDVKGDFPDVAGAFGEGGAALRLAGDVAGAEFDGFGFGRENAEGDFVVVGGEFGRDDAWRLRAGVAGRTVGGVVGRGRGFGRARGRWRLWRRR
jgi:hypothetical protein